MEKEEIIRENDKVLANAVELGYQAIRKIAGNSLSDQLDGEHISQTLRDILTAKINTRLSHYRKG